MGLLSKYCVLLLFLFVAVLLIKRFLRLKDGLSDLSVLLHVD